MEIKDDKIEISKRSWVYKLLKLTTSSYDFRYNFPTNSCEVALKVAIRLGIIAIATLFFVSGWGVMLFGLNEDSVFQALLVVVAVLETLGLAVVGLVVGFCRFMDWFDNMKKTCPTVLWTEEKSNDE